MNEGKQMKHNTHIIRRGPLRCVMEILDLAPVCWYMAQASLCCRMWEKHPIDAKIRTGRKQGVGWQRQAGVREECSLFTRFFFGHTNTHTGICTKAMRGMQHHNRLH